MTKPETVMRVCCGICWQYFTTSDDEADLCPQCQADDDLQREMDRNVD